MNKKSKKKKRNEQKPKCQNIYYKFYYGDFYSQCNCDWKAKIRQKPMKFNVSWLSELAKLLPDLQRWNPVFLLDTIHLFFPDGEIVSNLLIIFGGKTIDKTNVVEQNTAGQTFSLQDYFTHCIHFHQIKLARCS